MQPVQAAKVDIPSIHDVDGTSLGYQHVERVNIVQLAVRDMDKARNVAAQIEQCVHLHRRFRRSEMCPWEHRQAKIDGGRIQRVDGVLQVQPKVLTGIQLPRLGNQCLRQGRVDTPVSRLVGIGQSRAPDRLTKAHVIEFRRLRRQAGLNVAQAFTVGQLGEGHRPVLLRAGQRSHTVIATIPLDQPGEGRPGNELHQLREQGLAGIHCGLQAETSQPRHASNSSRHHPFSPGNQHNSWRSWSRLFS